MPFNYASAVKQYKQAEEGPKKPTGQSVTSSSVGTQDAPRTQPKTLAGKAVGGVFSFLGGVARGIAKPIVSPFVQMPRALAAGVAGLAGDEEAKARFSRPVSVPGLGEIKGLSAVPEDVEKYGTATAGQMAGQALELGSTLIGGKAVSTVGQGLKQPLKTVAVQGLKEGAKTGALASAGQMAQEEGATVEDVVGAGVTGGAIGGALGIAVPVLARGGQSIWRSVMSRPSGGVSKAASGAMKALDDGGVPPGGVGPGASSALSEATESADDAVKATTGAKRTKPVMSASKQPVRLAAPLKEEAVNAGFDERVVDLVDGASAADRAKMQKMVTQAERASKSRLVRERPVNTAGESVIARVKHVSQARKKIGKSYGEAVKALPESPVSIEGAKRSFIDSLAEDGVYLGDDGALAFDKTRYANDPGSQKLIKQIYGEVADADALTPKEIITMRQRIFDDLDLGKKQQNMSSRTEALLKRFRDEVDQPLREASEDYATLSRQYAETSDALSEFYQLLGKKFSDADEDILSLRAGEVGSRMGGNASADVIRILDKLERVAQKTGMKAEDDLARQFFFADVLDDIYGITQPRSLQGGVQRGTQAALDNTIENVGMLAQVATGRPTSALGTLYARATGKTREDQQQILRKILGMDFQERSLGQRLMGK